MTEEMNSHKKSIRDYLAKGDIFFDDNGKKLEGKEKELAKRKWQEEKRSEQGITGTG